MCVCDSALTLQERLLIIQGIPVEKNDILESITSELRELRGNSTYSTNNCLAFMCYVLFKKAYGSDDDGVKYIYSLIYYQL